MPRETSPQQLKTLMKESGLKLRWVAARAGVEYFRASQVLNGHRISPSTLGKLSRVITSASKALASV